MRITLRAATSDTVARSPQAPRHVAGLVHAGFVNLGRLEWRAGNTDWSVKV